MQILWLIDTNCNNEKSEGRHELTTQLTSIRIHISSNLSPTLPVPVHDALRRPNLYEKITNFPLMRSQSSHMFQIIDAFRRATTESLKFITALSLKIVFFVLDGEKLLFCSLRNIFDS